jgi:epoxyqueuosine reductase
MMTSDVVKQLALGCDFELVGVTAATRVPEARDYDEWLRAGHAGEMSYLTDRRGDMRQDSRRLFPSARSVICVGKLYNGPEPYSTTLNAAELAWISRYAWGDDYHDLLRRDLKRLAQRMAEQAGDFESRICVDTAPFLDAAHAHRAGLGWIGKNTCLINQQQGSWFFLGALLTSLELAPDDPPPERCGTCTRCIEACPTDAIVQLNGNWTVDARRCISYLTIELRGSIPEPLRSGLGNHVFGCDVCQDVCPWNHRAPTTRVEAFAPRLYAPPLESLAALGEDEFRELFRRSPVSRAKYRGFMRNVMVAIGNSGQPGFKTALTAHLDGADELIREHARWALRRLGQ